jgi:hypothetical protein
MYRSLLNYLLVCALYFWGILADNDYRFRSGASEERMITALATKASNYCTVNKKCLPGAFDAHILTLNTASGVPFEAFFFDRNSDTVLVLGQGFPGPKESMLGFVKLFSTYDIIVFDYRWVDILSFCLKPSTVMHPLKTLIYQEQEEVDAIMSFLNNKKKYAQKVCLGQCYSAFSFVVNHVEGQKRGKKVFDKLILDSCPYSLEAFAETISLDPWLPFSPQYGGAPECIKSLLKIPIVRKTLLTLLKLVAPSDSIKEYLLQLNDTPVLFIHGKHDLMVPLDHFDLIWAAAATSSKAALITPYRHADNKRDRELFLFVCDQFIAAPDITNFIDTMIS